METIVAPTDNVTAAMSKNFLAWIPLFEHLPGAIVDRVHGCVRWTSPLPLPFLNGVVGWPDQDAPGAVDEVLGPFDAGPIPLLWVALPDQDASRELAARGFDVGSPPGMSIDLSDLPPLEPPRGITIRVADDPASIFQAFSIALETNGLPTEATAPVCEAYAALPDRHIARTYLATADGEPAAASTLWGAAGVAGLYNVGTLPAYRGRGIGRAVSIAAMADGRDLGYRVGVLQATDEGESIYRSIGFEQRCRFTFALRIPR